MGRDGVLPSAADAYTHASRTLQIPSTFAAGAGEGGEATRWPEDPIHRPR